MRKSFYDILTDVSPLELQLRVQERLNSGWQLGGFSTSILEFHPGTGEPARSRIVFIQVVYKVHED